MSMTVATNSSAKTPHTTGVSGTRLLVALATSVGLSLGAGFATAYGLPLFSALGERRIGVLCRTRRLVPRRTTTNLGGSRRSFSSQPCLPSSVITVECLRFVRDGVQVLHPFTRFLSIEREFLRVEVAKAHQILEVRPGTLQRHRGLQKSPE